MQYSSLPLATTELPTVIQNNVHGFVSADPDELLDRMRYLLDNSDEAKRMGDNVRRLALSRFGLARFVRDWNTLFSEETATHSSPAYRSPA